MSFYEGLSEKAHEVLGILQRGAREERSGAEVLRKLRMKGIKYTDSVFYKDYGIISAHNKSFKGMRNIRRDHTITEKWYGKAGTQLKTADLHTIFEIETYDPTTGKTIIEHLTVAHQNPRQRGVLEEAALFLFRQYGKDVEVTGIKPVAARRSATLW